MSNTRRTRRGNRPDSRQNSIGIKKEPRLSFHIENNNNALDFNLDDMDFSFKEDDSDHASVYSDLLDTDNYRASFNSGDNRASFNFGDPI
jgi:hypothetical protein